MKLESSKRGRMKVKKKGFVFLFAVLLSLFSPVSPSFSQNRDSWQQPEKVMDAIGVRPGMTIGEVGAGRGYFTFHLAKRVGNTGRVYANDINQSALRSIEDRCRREAIGHITTVLGEVEDPLLPNGVMDLIIMVYVLHDLAKPVELLRNLQSALKPEAPLVILEQDPEKTADSHFYKKEKLLEIVAEAGYELVRIETFLSKDTIYLFKPTTNVSKSLSSRRRKNET